MSALSDPDNRGLEPYRLGLYQHLNTGNLKKVIFSQSNCLVKFEVIELHLNAFMNINPSLNKDIQSK